MTLGQNIQTARRAKGLSQEQLAGQVGVSRQALGKWEKDTALPGLDNLQALAQALEVSVDGLLGRDTAAAPALTLEDLRALLDARDAEQTKARRRTMAAAAAAGNSRCCAGTLHRQPQCPGGNGVPRQLGKADLWLGRDLSGQPAGAGCALSVSGRRRVDAPQAAAFTARLKTALTFPAQRSTINPYIVL